MYHSQVGMFAIPLLDHTQLRKLYGMAFGIPRIDDDVYNCEPIPGKLFTNASGVAQDWVPSLEGRSCTRDHVSVAGYALLQNPAADPAKQRPR